MRRTGMAAATVMVAFGIAVGAFGAHGLKAIVTDEGLLANFETGARYWMYAALALLALTAVGISRWAAGLLAGGAAIFAGSLWLMAFTGARWLGAITPIGGVGMIAGLLLAAVGLYRGPTPATD
ncbi:DUF423 domain-containing protein [Parenemella sanctibonifatiensis]|uniref:DUF423 domain-containing protein n=1 Tax=Parenemella sanctibonifatiensis TaxID=2016505 RepID=A0A255ECX4_9ACTN|nr:DUF423 domain-containing protein [Parenemella sanctibonifatiensis]OYN88761.1 DUF423 domain-containing protein [Parenemella sanctibonifatiensis]